MQVSQMPPYTIRMHPDLMGWLKKKAEEEHRSLNQEIVYRLEKTRKEDEVKEVG